MVFVYCCGGGVAVCAHLRAGFVQTQPRLGNAAVCSNGVEVCAALCGGGAAAIQVDSLTRNRAAAAAAAQHSGAIFTFGSGFCSAANALCPQCGVAHWLGGAVVVLAGRPLGPPVV